MAKTRGRPHEALAVNRQQALELVKSVGLDKTRKILERADRSLIDRLKEVPGPGDKTFTRVQLESTLKQVRHVMRELTPGLARTVVDGAAPMAEKSAGGLFEYLTQADKQFRGVGSQPLALDEASVIDVAAQGARASVLRRLASSGEPVVNADDQPHPAKEGILERYGESTIGQFEDVLQQGLVTRASWDVMKAQLIEKSPFLQGKPASWAERIVRTELMGAYNRAGWEANREANEQLGDMCKILAATFDDRTAADSYAVHGQIRRPNEAFETWFGFMQHPPARPNDREIVVPHRVSWRIPDYLRWMQPEAIAQRWYGVERRKEPLPKRPEMTTISLDEFGKM